MVFDANKDIISDLPAALALSRCDTVACCHWIENGTAIKVLKSLKCLLKYISIVDILLYYVINVRIWYHSMNFLGGGHLLRICPMMIFGHQSDS